MCEREREREKERKIVCMRVCERETDTLSERKRAGAQLPGENNTGLRRNVYTVSDSNGFDSFSLPQAVYELV